MKRKIYDIVAFDWFPRKDHSGNDQCCMAEKNGIKTLLGVCFWVIKYMLKYDGVTVVVQPAKMDKEYYKED